MVDLEKNKNPLNNNDFSFIGMREPVPPILNEKLIQMTTKIGESILIPCVAYANPRASYR